MSELSELSGLGIDRRLSVLSEVMTYTDRMRATFPHMPADQVAYLAARLEAVEASLAHGRGRGL
jgi:hypothetical protein